MGLGPGVECLLSWVELGKGRSVTGEAVSQKGGHWMEGTSTSWRTPKVRHFPSIGGGGGTRLRSSGGRIAGCD